MASTPAAKSDPTEKAPEAETIAGSVAKDFAVPLLVAVLGSFIFWWFQSAPWFRRRDDFIVEILKARSEWAGRADNLDRDFIVFYRDTIRHLKPHADSLRANHGRRWKKIEKAWDEYARTGQSWEECPVLLRNSREKVIQKLNTLEAAVSSA
jgi:hypothetical protein